MACVCASAISAEMSDWVKLGGGNSGCCGNAAHTYGFHREASAVPVTDYSRRHESAKPYRMNWGCAGDFHHGYDAKLMAMHAEVLRRLMAGELPMIAEMITKPWKDKPVYYWARWNGNGTLQKYTGKGHDHWSHISWWRSKANQRAYLWTPSSGGGGGGSVDVNVATVAPKYPGYPLKQSTKADANVRVWQAEAKARGAKLAVDSVFGPGTKAAVLAFQKANRMATDAIIGPKTWQGIWNKSMKIS
jgi:hypothetical protein